MASIVIDNDFGYRELEIAGKLLQEIANSNISKNGLTIEFNRNTGDVFALNDDGVTYMLNSEGKLETFYILSGSGYEGFYEDLLSEYELGNIDNKDDLEDLKDIAAARHDYDTETMIRIELDYSNEVGYLQKGLTRDADELTALRAVAEKFGHENVVAMANEALEDIADKYYVEGIGVTQTPDAKTAEKVKASSEREL